MRETKSFLKENNRRRVTPPSSLSRTHLVLGFHSLLLFLGSVSIFLSQLIRIFLLLLYLNYRVLSLSLAHAKAGSLVIPLVSSKYKV